MNYRLILVKKNKRWLWTVVNHFSPGILAWRLGDRSANTFEPLWQMIRGWQSFFYITDGSKVYPRFINDCDHLVLKTYMTRVEGENTRLRHCARGASPGGLRLRKAKSAIPFGDSPLPKATSANSSSPSLRRCGAQRRIDIRRLLD